MKDSINHKVGVDTLFRYFLPLIDHISLNPAKLKPFCKHASEKGRLPLCFVFLSIQTRKLPMGTSHCPLVLSSSLHPDFQVSAASHCFIVFWLFSGFLQNLKRVFQFQQLFKIVSGFPQS